VMKQMDSDKDGFLSFAEFKIGILNFKDEQAWS
jgi:hypothetical protein